MQARQLEGAELALPAGGGNENVFGCCAAGEYGANAGAANDSDRFAEGIGLVDALQPGFEVFIEEGTNAAAGLCEGDALSLGAAGGHFLPGFAANNSSDQATPVGLNIVGH